jgi:hypothetical protein
VLRRIACISADDRSPTISASRKSWQQKYDEAGQAFNYYLLNNPSATERRKVQDGICALSAKRKLSAAK